MATKAAITNAVSAAINDNVVEDVTPEDARAALTAIATLDQLRVSSTVTSAVTAAAAILIDNTINLVTVADQRAAITGMVDAVAAWVAANSGTVDRTAVDASIAAYGANAKPKPGDLRSLLLAILDAIATWAETQSLDPVITALSSAVTGYVTGSVNNSGSWVGTGTVTLTANLGAVVKNTDGTWTWTRAALLEDDGDSITITITDDEGTDTVTFTTAIANPPAVTQNSDTITGSVGQLLTNSGTWGHTGNAGAVALTSSLGSVVKNTNGTWSWSYRPMSSVDTTVTITASNGNWTSQVQFDLTAVSGEPPAVDVDELLVTAADGAAMATTGTWAGDSNATLVASLGVITKNNDGTWDWSYTADADNDTAVVTITLTSGSDVDTAKFTLDISTIFADLPVYMGSSSYATFRSDFIGDAAANNAQEPLYQGESILKTATRAWMATDDPQWLDQGLDYAEGMQAAASDTVSIDAGASDAEGYRPQSSLGAIDAGTPYKSWFDSVGSGDAAFLRQGQYAAGVYYMCFETLSGPKSSIATQTQKDRAKAILLWTTRNVMEKEMCTAGFGRYSSLIKVEMSAARKNTDVGDNPNSAAGFWIDTQFIMLNNLAYVEHLYPVAGESVPSWMANHDIELMMKIFLGIGPLLGTQNTGGFSSVGEDLRVNPIEWYQSSYVIVDRGNTNAPQNDAFDLVHGSDTTHANRWPMCLQAFQQCGIGDTALKTAVSLWLARYEQNANLILKQFGDNNEYVAISHRANGFRDEALPQNLPAIYPTWLQYGSGNPSILKRSKRFWAQLAEWEAIGRSTNYPGVSDSMHINYSPLGTPNVVATLAAAMKLSETQVFGTPTV